MQRKPIRTGIFSMAAVAALCTVPIRTPLHAQNPSGDPAATTTTDRDDDGPDLGWLGLVGLAGLLGLRRRHDERDTTLRTPRT